MSTTPSSTAAPAVEETPDEWAAKIARLRSRKPAETWLTIPDPDALRAVESARQRLLAARQAARRTVPEAGSLSSAELDAFISDAEPVKAAVRDVETALAEAEALEVVFHLRALPPHVYGDLAAHHPPAEDGPAGAAWNGKTYVPALIAACSVKPITAEQVRALIEPQPDPDDPDGEPLPPALNQGDVGALFQTCVDLNEKPRMMLGKGSRPTPS